MTEWPSEHGWLIFLLSGIILTIVSNALWEYALRSACAGLGKLAWKGISHGGGRLADSIVRGASYRKDPTNYVTLRVFLVITISALASTSALWQVIKSDAANAMRTELQIRSIDSTPTADRGPKLQNFLEQLQKTKADKTLKLEHQGLLGAQLLSIILVISLMYVLRALVIQYLVRSFDRLLAIRKPKISDQRVAEIEARWAAMKTVRDFNSVWTFLTLADCVRSSGAERPK